MKKFFITLMVIIGFFALSLVSTSPAQAGETPNINICHRVGPTHVIPGRPLPPKIYESITVSKQAILNGKSEHVAQDPTDIIPPFEYGGKSFPGQSWTPENQTIYNNSCAAPSKTVTPIAPTFEAATCMNPTGTVTLAEQPKGVKLNIGPRLNSNGIPGSDTTGAWVVSYVAEEGYTIPDDLVTFTFPITAPGPSDPLWDAEASECRIANTGISGISNTALMLGGLAIGAGMIALATSISMGRDKA